MNYKNFNDYLKHNIKARPTHVVKKMMTTPIDSPRERIHKFPTILQTKIMVADSRDRNTDLFPNSNQFKIKGQSSSSGTIFQTINIGGTSILKAIPTTPAPVQL